MGEHVVDEGLRTLHVENHGRARMAREEIAGEERENQVGLVPPPALVDHPHAVGIAVVGEPHVRARLQHLGHEIAGVLFHLRIGQVVRKGAVGFAVELDHLRTQAPEQLGREAARDAVARVHHYLERARQGHPRRDGVEVLAARVSLRAVARAPLEVTARDGGEESLDLVFGQRRRSPVHHLHAVVGDGVVAARDGGAPVEFPVGGREVEEGRVVHADIHHVQPGREGARGKSFLEGRRGGAIVHAEGDARPAAAADERAVGPAHLGKDFGRDVDAHFAADVVGPEDIGVDAAHDRPGLRSRRSLRLR